MFFSPRTCSKAAACFFCLATMLAAYLGVTGMRSGNLAGCGEQSGCEALLSGRWAKIYPGIPVAVPAALVYATLAGMAMTRGRSRLTWFLLGLVVGSAAWFVALQVREQAFCPYCTATHACALLGSGLLMTREIAGNAPAAMTRWLLPGLGGLGLAAIMALIQITVPFEASQSETGRHAILAPDARELAELPGVGSARNDATRAILLFDYCCPHCRTVQAELLAMDKALASAGVWVAFLPAPLDTDCNPFLLASPGPGFDQACDYALAMLGLWRRDPQRHDELLALLLEPGPLPGIGEVEMLADGQPAGEALAWASGMVAEGARLYGETVESTGVRALPILLLLESPEGVRTMQGKMSEEDLREFLLPEAP